MQYLLRKSMAMGAIILMLVTLFLVPLSASAKMVMSNGQVHGNPGAGEGDPLDSNDSNNGGGDDIVHNQRVLPGGYPLGLLDSADSGLVLMLTVEFIGDVPVFRVDLVRVADSRHGGHHAY